MVLNKTIASKTASYLLQINAIKLNIQNPYKWSSGWNSPIYCDNRICLSFPKIRDFLANSIADEIKKNVSNNFIIAGVATGAIGIGMLVANKLNAPFIYVRPEKKKHGRKNQIEGTLNKNEKVIVIEDLISTGKSSLNAVDAIQNNGAKVIFMIALFNYDFEIAKKNFTNKNIELKTLCDYKNLIETAKVNNLINEDEIKSLLRWRKNPEKW
ncbi:MAG: orotate phosphoribosyltransferase [Flavobacteriaceae bacterium]|nr:orotate phosphoribosyltransferase [Flavobacteriaceae bacterium]|tara:strand:- start:74148 stop:74783 length:636 start_codon:yes stop_codon:yes gene_type:complete